jgi:hypothetical protein
MAFGFEDVEDFGGELVVDKEQSSVIEKINGELEQSDPHVKHGLCMGYSATWIKMCSQGDDFWQYVDSADARANLRMMARREGNIGTMAQQGLFEKMPEDVKKQILADQGKWTEELLLRSGAVEKSEKRYERDGFSGDAIFDLCEHLTGSEGYKLLCMKGKTKGSHAVAVSVSDGKVTYMDPNAGEAKFENRDEFSFWFATKHLPKYSFAKFEGFYIDSYSGSVNPAQTAQQYTKWRSYDLPTGTRRPFMTTDRTHPGGQASVAKLSAMPATGSSSV